MGEAGADFDCDVVVIGGGPAGAAAAARVQRRGHRACVVEREAFPRFHIGESLLPLGDPVFEQIGCRDALQRAGFHQKRGAQLNSACGEHKVVFDFEEQRIRPTSTIQVYRAQFDALLLEHARALGAELVQANAERCAFDADGVTVTAGARAIRGRAVIDASGRRGVVAKQLGVRVADDELKKASVYAHFRRVRRDDGVRAGDTRIVTLPKLGWMWLIPLSDDVTSVGVVLDLDDYRQHDKGDLGAIFDRALDGAPHARALLRDAERCSEFGAESGFSYRAERYAGDRWFLAGDAGSFLDPVWSTGVQMALQSGVEAADAALDGYVVAAPRPARALRRYDAALQRRYRFVRRFVLGFYDRSMRDLFFSPRPYFGIHRAVTKVLAGAFELGPLDRLRLSLFFLLGRLQARFELVPRQRDPDEVAAAAPAMEGP